MKLSPAMKILVVDDCLDARNHIKLILRKKGFKKVVGAHDGREGIQILQESFEDFDPVCLVLADWQMPDMDGIEFLAQMRTDPRFKDIPFIMITYDNDREHVIQAISTGVDNYMVKPIKADTLLKKISSTFHGREAS
ncbi:response regulator [Bacteriovorax sp. DB6_IX]|uniref:response regulator n=1 Tax=Bacteriovorax sp. DB6_IX TaxID=1353530 RepID=UPI00038A3EF0|nr:response regulator [Bacteriovorax sp. DB6_IX]EQC51093.1 response regulator receiver domain protein [Bacteriovorax sp. DB6_IX]